jgi:hypothetical protein
MITGFSAGGPSMSRRSALLCVVMVAATASSGCEYIQDRLRTCDERSVELFNRPPGGQPVYLAPTEEPFTSVHLVQPGHLRIISLCMERGDQKTFRAGRFPDAVPIGRIDCVVTQDRPFFESSTARVVWETNQFTCENW